mmetsp:Transcript_17530/g.21503  ORF Transcript_17530/g.21503 Transcript_17530/m.21503 type:complete len:466 (-) Transcript_17530:180-1577(-)
MLTSLFAVLVLESKALVALNRHSLHRRRKISVETNRGVEEYETVECAAEKNFQGVKGTLFRAGPCDDNGNGALAAITFDGSNKVFSRVRYVRTKRYIKNLEDGPKAVGCFFWANRLFATQDAGQPYQIDPLSLGTQKLSDLGGQCEDRFDPWVRINAQNHRLLNAKLKRRAFVFLGGGGSTSEFEIEEFDAQFKRISRCTIPLVDGMSQVSDWMPCTDKTSFAVLCGKLGANKNQHLLVATKEQGDTPTGAPAKVIYSLELPFIHDSSASIIDCNFLQHNNNLHMRIKSQNEIYSILVDNKTPQLIESKHLGTADYALPLLKNTNQVDLLFNDLLLVRDATISLLSSGQEWTSSNKNARIGIPTIINNDSFLILITHANHTELALFSLFELEQITSVSLPSTLPSSIHFRGPFVPNLTPNLDEIKKAETLTRLYAKKAREWNEIEGGFSGLGIKSFLFPKGVSGG